MKIKAILHVHSCFASVSSGDVFLERDLDLPTVPFIGSRLQFDAGAEPQVEAVYFHENGEIKVYVEPDKHFYNLGLKTSPMSNPKFADFKALVVEYLESGWELPAKEKNFLKKEKWGWER